jgi:hypothetical protein
MDPVIKPPPSRPAAVAFRGGTDEFSCNDVFALLFLVVWRAHRLHTKSLANTHEAQTIILAADTSH